MTLLHAVLFAVVYVAVVSAVALLIARRFRVLSERGGVPSQALTVEALTRASRSALTEDTEEKDPAAHFPVSTAGSSRNGG